MENQEADVGGTKPIRRFVTYEEFLKAFYPESTEKGRIEDEDDSGDFGTDLAIDSLERHADILKF